MLRMGRSTTNLKGDEVVRAYDKKDVIIKRVMSRYDVRRHAPYHLEKYNMGRLVGEEHFNDFYEMKKAYAYADMDYNIGARAYIDGKRIEFLDAQFMFLSNKDFLDLIGRRD